MASMPGGNVLWSAVAAAEVRLGRPWASGSADGVSCRGGDGDLPGAGLAWGGIGSAALGSVVFGAAVVVGFAEAGFLAGGVSRTAFAAVVPGRVVALVSAAGVFCPAFGAGWAVSDGILGAAVLAPVGVSVREVESALVFCVIFVFLFNFDGGALARGVVLSRAMLGIQR